MVTRGVIVYIAGERWGVVEGTDRRLAAALARVSPVLWVDPPLSVLRRGSGGFARSTVVQEGDNVLRLQTSTPPGPSRRGMRPLVERIMAASIRSAVAGLGAEVSAVIVAAPLARFPARVGGRRILFVTDDWVAGAGLMRLGARDITTALRENVAAADVVAAVTPGLLSSLTALSNQSAISLSTPGAIRKRLELIPNGCEEPVAAPEHPAIVRTPVAGLVGQLNERLDLDALDAVSARGVRILVIGPRTERDPETTLRLDAFLDGENVTWLGAKPFAELPPHLATITVGMTPYADTAFNRASFPLKTLEYLSHGLSVVSTDLPAVHWLDTDLIAVAHTPQGFADEVESQLRRRVNQPGAEEDAERSRRRRFARGHSWDVRATTLLDIISDAEPHRHSPEHEKQLPTGVVP